MKKKSQGNAHTMIFTVLVVNIIVTSTGCVPHLVTRALDRSGPRMFRSKIGSETVDETLKNVSAL